MPLKIKVEHLSFEDEGQFLDIKLHIATNTISINTAEMIVSKDRVADCEFHITFEDWKQIDKEVRKLFTNMQT